MPPELIADNPTDRLLGYYNSQMTPPEALRKSIFNTTLYGFGAVVKLRPRDIYGTVFAADLEDEVASEDTFSLIRAIMEINQGFQAPAFDWFATLGGASALRRLASMEVVSISGDLYKSEGATMSRPGAYRTYTDVVIVNNFDTDNLSSYDRLSVGDVLGIDAFISSGEASGTGWKTQAELGNITATGTSSAAITVPPGQGFRIEISYAAASGTSTSDVFNLYPAGSDGSASKNSVLSHTNAHATASPQDPQPFGVLTSGTWIVEVVAGAVQINSVTFKVQRVY